MDTSFAPISTDYEEDEKILLTDPVINFFIQAADNDYFFERNRSKLFFKDGLELDHLSDGEYQILFLYALIDLFDEEDTLFLFDEADSHLHYQNVERFWKTLTSLKGRTITTTHLLDSITANPLENIHVVKDGVLDSEDKIKKLIDRLSILSRAKSVEFQICNKIEHCAVLDHYNDWKIFIALAEQKGLRVSNLAAVCPLKKGSSYNSTNEKFGETKINWAAEYAKAEKNVSTKNLFLICDRDEAPLEYKPNGVEISGEQYRKRLNGIRFSGANVKLHLLAWKRREIKNYLLSYTALTHFGSLELINNDEMATSNHLVAGNPSDNEGIQKCKAKDAVDPHINSENGLCSIKLKEYISKIPASEISEDITNMFNFILSKIQ